MPSRKPSIPPRHQPGESPTKLEEEEAIQQELDCATSPSVTQKETKAASASPFFTADTAALCESIQLIRQQQQQQQQQQLATLLSQLSCKLDTFISKTQPGEAGPSEVRHSAPPRKEEEPIDVYSSDDDEEFYHEAPSGDYVPHALYRSRIGAGFAKRSPPDLAPDKPEYYTIDDQVTRHLASSKYSAKLTEYNLTVSQAFFSAIVLEAAKDACSAHADGDDKAVGILLHQIVNNLSVTTDLQKDRMFFLEVSSDPNAPCNKKDFAHDILRNNFVPSVREHGVSDTTAREFAHYEGQRRKAILGASAKAAAHRHLAASSGWAGSSSGGGSSSSKRTDPKTSRPKPAQGSSGKDSRQQRQPTAERAESDTKKGKEKKEKRVSFEDDA